MERQVIQVIQGRPAVDGAGVRLNRVLGPDNVLDFDPFLMLDSFDSGNPRDYLAGFPMHPHRGIETITYLLSGRLAHQDSLGNKGMIEPGGSQWMTAGSGILHQEMPQASERFLGFQLWLNLPAAEKFTEPKYFDILAQDVVLVQESGRQVRIISGRYAGKEGARSHHIPATILDIGLEPGVSVEIPVADENTAFLFLIQGNLDVEGETYKEKAALLLGEGDRVAAQAPAGGPARFAFISAKPLHEPVAWGGPIVMNTREELRQAFDDLQNGTFIKHSPSW